MLCSIYAPYNEDTDIYLHPEVNVILGNMEGQIVLAGDFNLVMIDRSTFTSNSTPKDRLAIHILAEDMGLTDIWRCIHPNDREDTYFLPLP